MTDIIEKAIREGKHESRHAEVRTQTWARFHEQAKGKSICIYGIGKATDFFLRRVSEEEQIRMVADGNPAMQGKNAGWYLSDKRTEDHIIQCINNISGHDACGMIFLICGINSYDEIIDQLNGMGIKQCFVALVMEANLRSVNPDDGYETSLNCLLQECDSLPVVPNKFVFFSDGKFTDHGKYIANQLLKSNRNLDLVWLLEDEDIILPAGMRKVYLHRPGKAYREISTAGFYITNGKVYSEIKKKKGQTFIQTKHWASVTLKRFYLDAATITDSQERNREWIKAFGMLDYVIAGSKFDEESCRRGFHFNGQFIRAGSPRSDALFDNTGIRERIYDYYSIPFEEKVLLYAPTYRYRKNTGTDHIPESREIDLDYDSLLEALEYKFHCKWRILLRLHPNVRAYAKKIATKDRVIDASMYQDSEELCAACDIMISDYSSIMFEPAFVKKPVFLFATDKEEYIDKEYDLLLDYDALPFPMAETNEQLTENVRSFDQEEYEKKITDFLDLYGVHEDGHASERAAEFILKLMK